MNKHKAFIALLVIGFTSILVPFIVVTLAVVTSASVIYSFHLGTFVLLLFIYGWKESGSLKEWLKGFI